MKGAEPSSVGKEPAKNTDEEVRKYTESIIRISLIYWSTLSSKKVPSTGTGVFYGSGSWWIQIQKNIADPEQDPALFLQKEPVPFSDLYLKLSL